MIQYKKFSDYTLKFTEINFLFQKPIKIKDSEGL